MLGICKPVQITTSIYLQTYAKILTVSLLENWRRPPKHPHTMLCMKSNNLSVNEVTDVAQNCQLS